MHQSMPLSSDQLHRSWNTFADFLRDTNDLVCFWPRLFTHGYEEYLETICIELIIMTGSSFRCIGLKPCLDKESQNQTAIAFTLADPALFKHFLTESSSNEQFSWIHKHRATPHILQSVTEYMRNSLLELPNANTESINQTLEILNAFDDIRLGYRRLGYSSLIREVYRLRLLIRAGYMELVDGMRLCASAHLHIDEVVAWADKAYRAIKNYRHPKRKLCLRKMSELSVALIDATTT